MNADAPQQWEYRVVQPPRETSQKEARDPSSVLNEAADEGWELDETIDYVGGGTKFLVFRRPADGDDGGSDETTTDFETDDE
ncbi:hypothetical protein [Halorussus lipolyticus]|uniref:hypothetical protein n=1 Tax=Halorussus lipolyticus TaxID=3034024 RepID=UPI0023E8B60F|nr:hypothetical protein [Halorussus sp. DT80]